MTTRKLTIWNRNIGFDERIWNWLFSGVTVTSTVQKWPWDKKR